MREKTNRQSIETEHLIEERIINPPEVRGNRCISSQDINALVTLYEEFLKDPSGPVDEARNQMIWLNNMNLFNVDEVKVFLEEKGLSNS